MGERGKGWFREEKVMTGKRGVLREFREGEAMEASGCGQWRHIAWDNGGGRRRNAQSNLTDHLIHQSSPLKPLVNCVIYVVKKI